jgi:hypothetical protein
MEEWGVNQNPSLKERMKALSSMNPNLKSYVEYEDVR